eukprot:CAMPEP_0181363926 /NCGR_PEP_ID=MMETSP1106-20121128/9054_1 /TAXON_ID=81844 /ORGANISM="Mantoniella antarctica, Strain SL-175" /LENGTH=336 /DNA_ID=CAMNT_0023478487 /DNA_START=301 /DNA_END=1311 /DNA_ORIENTATION=-
MRSCPVDEEVPVVSTALYDTDFPGFVEALGAAYGQFGFVILQDHGLSMELIDSAQACSRKFFAMSKEEKMRYNVAGQGGARGYTAFGVETAKGSQHHDLKEFWHRGRELEPGHRFEALMPPNAVVAEGGFTAATAEIFSALDALGGKVLEALAVHLGQERAYFADKVDDGNSILRVIHYPPLAREGEDGEQALARAGHVRAGAHEDINLITLLLGADEGGLQILARGRCEGGGKDEGEPAWLEVNPPPGCVTCNIGDMLQRLSNHRLPSTTHRVVNPPPERAHLPRYSMPFFLHPNPDFLIETLQTCVSAECPNRYPEAISSDDYLQERLREIKLK